MLRAIQPTLTMAVAWLVRFLFLTLPFFASLCQGRLSSRPRRFVTHYHNGHHKGTGASDLIDRCRLEWYSATLDHFSFSQHKKADESTFKLRYYICDEYYKKRGGSLFVYLGNEADVTLYLNNTGLMWESAERHHAMLVFLEHRFYGKSKPYPARKLGNHMKYLTTEQAMADYANIIHHLKANVLEDVEVPVIGFGGSYGGMLCTYFRLKYPSLMDGAIAASAPIWTYFGEGYDRGSFAKIVTHDASITNAHCAPNVRRSWDIMMNTFGTTKSGRDILGKTVKVCSALENEEDVKDLVDIFAESWDYLAMGNFPYESAYIIDGEGVLPAYPVKAACEYLNEEFDSDEELVSALAKAVGVYYNFSGSLSCYDIHAPPSSETENFWSYQFCTEHFMPMERDGIHDMFYDQFFNTTAEIEACQNMWGVHPDTNRGLVEWQGKHILEFLSNVVFSNGLLDPWSGGGVLQIPAELQRRNNLRTVIIPEGAHHLDLMFSNPKDPESVIHARRVENDMIASWIREKSMITSSFSEQ